MALQGDGKVVLVGYATDASGNGQVLVARLKTNGSFDSSFGTGGTLTAQLGAGATPSSGFGAVALQRDGKIVLAGGASDASGKNQVLVGRLTANGSPDPSFGTGGGLLAQFGGGATPSSGLSSMALQGDGKIVLAGSASDAGGNDQVLVARLFGDPVPPAILSARLSHKRFRVAHGPTAITAKRHAPRGTSFRFTLSARPR